MSSIAVVVGGGPVAPPPGGFATFDEVVAADSGLDGALAAGLEPQVLVGDLDSISPAGLRWAEDHGIHVERHDPDKDDTDTALALRWASGRGHRDLTVLGAATVDRLDHQLGTISALGAPGLQVFDHITARFGHTTLHVLHPGHRVQVQMEAGELFSLLALHGPCDGVDVDGARWPLHDARLAPGSTLGVSNEGTGGPVQVAVRAGVLTMVRPAVGSDTPEEVAA